MIVSSITTSESLYPPHDVGAWHCDPSFTARRGAQPEPLRASMPGRWLATVMKDLHDLSALRAGWSGPGSRPITPAALKVAERLLRDALEESVDLDPPSLVPVANGGLQMEWHRNGIDLEFYVEADGSHSVWLREEQGAVGVESEGLEAVRLLFRWAPRAAARGVHAPDLQAARAAFASPIAA